MSSFRADQFLFLNPLFSFHLIQVANSFFLKVKMLVKGKRTIWFSCIPVDNLIQLLPPRTQLLHERIDKFECKTEVGHFRATAPYETGPTRMGCVSVHVRARVG